MNHILDLSQYEPLRNRLRQSYFSDFSRSDNKKTRWSTYTLTLTLFFLKEMHLFRPVPVTETLKINLFYTYLKGFFFFFFKPVEN